MQWQKNTSFSSHQQGVGESKKFDFKPPYKAINSNLSSHQPLAPLVGCSRSKIFDFWNPFQAKKREVWAPNHHMGLKLVVWAPASTPVWGGGGGGGGVGGGSKYVGTVQHHCECVTLTAIEYY